MIIELYFLLVVLSIGLFIFGQFQKTIFFSLIGCALMFSLAIASLGIEIRHCELCQGTTENNTAFTEDEFFPEYTVRSCTMICQTDLINEKGLSALWFGLALIGIYATYQRYIDLATGNEKNNIWPKFS